MPNDDWPDVACHNYGYAHGEDPAVDLARILHRRNDNCHCGEPNDTSLHLAREVIWRMAAHGYVLCDIEYLAHLSDKDDEAGQ